MDDSVLQQIWVQTYNNNKILSMQIRLGNIPIKSILIIYLKKVWGFSPRNTTTRDLNKQTNA